MNQKRKGLFRGLGAAVTAVALAMVGAVGAQAAEQQPSTGNVIITKLEQPDTLGTAADGTQIPNLTDYVGINGVKFEAYLVPGVDLATNAGQQAASAMTVTAAQDVVTTGGASAVQTVTTETVDSQDGVAEFNGLARGLYLFKETGTPAGVTASPDFLVAVPMTNPTDNSTWMSNIYVYPKNSKIDAVKTVANANALTVGSKITWTVNTAIPLIPNPTSSTPKFVAPDAFQIVDTLDSKLEVAADDVVVTSPTRLEKGTDKDYTVVIDGQKVTIAFTSPGLAKLATAVNAEEDTPSITATIGTTVVTVGEVSNTADVYPNQESIDDEKPLTTDPVQVKYGSKTFMKKSTDNAVTGDKLAGAKFRVYASKTDAEAVNANYLKPTFKASEVPVGYSDGVWTSQSGGAINISGLRYSAFADGSAITEETSKQTYYLVEVEALADHQLLAAPIAFQVDDGPVSIDVTNAKTTGGFTLPLTGGTGTLMLTIGGAALLALVLLAVARRRSREEA